MLVLSLVLLLSGLPRLLCLKARLERLHHLVLKPFDLRTPTPNTREREVQRESGHIMAAEGYAPRVPAAVGELDAVLHAVHCTPPSSHVVWLWTPGLSRWPLSLPTWRAPQQVAAALAGTSRRWSPQQQSPLGFPPSLEASEHTLRKSTARHLQHSSSFPCLPSLGLLSPQAACAAPAETTTLSI